MKRLLLSVFAAAITAAMVLPVAATASDVTFSGSYKLRGESRAHATFTKGDNNDPVWHQRTRLTANAAATDDTTVKVTIQDTRDWGSAQAGAGGPALTESGSYHLDVHEASLNLKNLLGTGVALTAGRQEINLGDQRLVGAFGWNQNGRSFDALRLDYAAGDSADILLISSKINEVGNGDRDQDFYVGQVTVKTIPNNTLDLYAMLLRDSSSTQMVTNGQTSVTGINDVQTMWTYGGRLNGNVPGIGVTYTGEVALQTGEVKGATTLDIDALAYAIKLGYALPNNSNMIKFGYEYASASGDGNSTDNKLETFSNLFPTNHGHFGIADRQGWRNMNAHGFKAQANVNDQLTVKAAYWLFGLDEKTDAVYGAGNWNTSASLIAANATGTQDKVGSELDLVANYKINKAVGLQAGWARYFTDDVIDTSVGSANAEDQDFAYLQLLAKF